MMGAHDLQVIMNEYVDAESYPSVFPLLSALKEQSLNLTGVIVDGHRPVIRAFRDVWPGITVQRCLWHVQREGLRWMRRYPKTLAARELKGLLCALTAVKTIQARDEFMRGFAAWRQRHESFVRSLVPTSVACKDLKRATALLINALPDMFHYLDDPNLRSTTSALESFYSRLKGDFRRHRGLSLKHKISYLRWYCYLQNRKIINTNRVLSPFRQSFGRNHGQ